MGVNEGNAPAFLDIILKHVVHDGGFSRSGLTDDIDMAGPVVIGKTNGVLGIPKRVFPKDHIKVSIVLNRQRRWQLPTMHFDHILGFGGVGIGKVVNIRHFRC